MLSLTGQPRGGGGGPRGPRRRREGRTAELAEPLLMFAPMPSTVPFTLPSRSPEFISRGTQLP